MRNVRSTTQTSVAVLKSAAKGVMVAIEGVRVRVRVRVCVRERERERKKERKREKERQRERAREERERDSGFSLNMYHTGPVCGLS